ncbi:hypothetical protein C8J57DRAFT_1528121 [Mycena rebaudengoi]|nr:hypothetical protein C8J57DRAFT_1528121 [Mycena rebaudengoi]
MSGRSAGTVCDDVCGKSKGLTLGCSVSQQELGSLVDDVGGIEIRNLYLYSYDCQLQNFLYAPIGHPAPKPAATTTRRAASTLQPETGCKTCPETFQTRHETSQTCHETRTTRYHLRRVFTADAEKPASSPRRHLACDMSPHPLVPRRTRRLRRSPTYSHVPAHALPPARPLPPAPSRVSHAPIPSSAAADTVRAV